jgi:hypothetical protein
VSARIAAADRRSYPGSRAADLQEETTKHAFRFAGSDEDGG